jgi:YesN/AraC family two-component response regulator
LLATTEKAFIGMANWYFFQSTFSSNETLIDILSHIDEHYADCSLQQLSQIFHFSSKYLGNLIKKKTGYTFQQLLENARMNKICYYLEHSELPVREIAQNCGYSNLTFFFRRFDERYHLTPAMYRRKIKNGRSL